MVPSPVLHKTSPAPTGAARLNRDDWLDAAFAAAVEHGFDGVRVLVLADTLGVTRGSFYWHFKDHAELITALLERWRAAESASTQRLQQPGSEDPVKDLALFAGKFARITPDAKTAIDLASLFYLTIVGSFQALSRPQAAHPTKQYLTDIIGRYLIKPQAH